MSNPRRRLVNLSLSRIDLVDAGDNPGARVMLFKRLEPADDDRSDVLKATWSTAFVNDLPDSSFAVIEPGGKKDSTGKTAPRSLRHLPYKDASGKADLPHLRNALARLPQTKIPANLKARAMARLRAAARAAGIAKAEGFDGEFARAFAKMGEEYASGVARTTDEILLERETFEAWNRVKWAFNDSLSAILAAAPTAERMTLLAKSVEEFIARVGEILPEAMAKRVQEALSDLSGEDEAIDAARVVLRALDESPLTKRARLDPTRRTTDPEGGMLTEKQIEDLQKRAQDAEALTKERDERIAALEAEVAKLKPADPEAEIAALPEPVRKRIQDERKRTADIEKRLDEADDARAITAIEKRLAPVALVGTTAEKFAPVVHRIVKGKATSEDVAEVERLLASQSEMIRKGKALEDLGGPGTPSEDDPIAKAEQLAAEKITKGLAKTKQEALEMVLSEHPELYREHAAAVGAGRRAS